MDKRLRLLITFLLATISAVLLAVPAKPGARPYVQPDGTVITVRVYGDEFYHYYESIDGLLLKPTLHHALHYATLDDAGNIIPGPHLATDPAYRDETASNHINTLSQSSLRLALQHQIGQMMLTRAQSPGYISTTFPTSGNVRGIVILADYQDVKFCELYDTHQVYLDLITGENYTGLYSTGSVRDYFYDQSSGVFIPEFDVVGPLTLPHNRAYYGSSTENGDNVSQMIIDACQLADNQYGVDFSKYDMDNDGYVDFVYVIYAGHGEAQGGPPESVWPQSWTLENAYNQRLDGKLLGRYACSCELSGGVGTVLDGIGTFCHEYGHILGLPDIYDTTSTGLFGMGHWDVMDVGAYNNSSRTPPAYSAMERYSLGWLNPYILYQPGGKALESIELSNTAYFLVSDHDPHEYYTFENRQPVKWDTYLPNSGLLISHIHYVPSLWATNRVNSITAGYEHVELITADNSKTYYDEDEDIFPCNGKYMSFTDTTEPPMVWHNGQKVGKPITNIKIGAAGIVVFDFIQATGVMNIAQDADLVTIDVKDGELCIENPLAKLVSVYSVAGQLMVPSTTQLSIKQHLPHGYYLINIEGIETVKIFIE